MIREGELQKLHKQLIDHPDVADDERLRLRAQVALLRFFGLPAVVAGFIGGYAGAVALMLYLQDRIEGRGLAGWCALLATGASMLLAFTASQIARAVVRARLRRALAKADARRGRLEAASLDASPIAVPSLLTTRDGASRRT